MDAFAADLRNGDSWRILPIAPTAALRRTPPVPSQTREHALRVETGPLIHPRSFRQAMNIATSALVIARMLISMIPNTNCTTQPI